MEFLQVPDVPGEVFVPVDRVDPVVDDGIQRDAGVRAGLWIRMSRTRLECSPA